MEPEVSVCIATFRRPSGLERLLESLARQKLPAELSLEILVVDNDPQASADLVAERLAGFPHPLRWLSEPRRNIARARNRALAEARGRWVAFIDDDEAADEDWLAAYARAAAREQADGFFGPVRGRLERNVTPWLPVQDFFQRPVWPDGSEPPAGALSTANAFLRRALFRDGSSFDPAFGRSGGSDTELFGRMRRSGARLLWCGEAGVVEFVPPQRHRMAWLAQRAFRGGCVDTRLRTRQGGLRVRLRVAARALAASLGLAACLPPALLAGRARAARVGLRLCVQAGHLWALLGGRYEEYRGRP